MENQQQRYNENVVYLETNNAIYRTAQRRHKSHCYITLAKPVQYDAHRMTEKLTS